MNRNNWKVITGVSLVTLIMGVVLGRVFFGGGHVAQVSSGDKIEAHQHDEVWTCSMHPQIRNDGPGKCPICGMELIPVGNNSQGELTGIHMSEQAMALANIQTTAVGFEQPMKEVRLNGKVKPDERKIFSQVTHIPGRVETLSINFTGEYINRGQTLATLYSPELVTAQQELMQAYKMRDSQPDLYRAAREKLKNWKLSDKTIDIIISSGGKQERFPVVADVSGIVISKNVNLGDYVERGKPLYEIADLSSVWILFEVYEADMGWIKVGDKISFTVQSIPGEKFEGKISFIDPLLDAVTRVATARVELANKNTQLKPEMFVRGTVKSELKNKEDKIILSKSAVLWTGERSVVYVKNETDKGVTFELREVMLGPSIGDAYVIASGLNRGEEVVTNGAFAVDAATQLAGKPSMMNPPEMTHVNDGTNIKTKGHVENLIEAYLKIKDAMVMDNLQAVKSNLKTMNELLDKINMHDFSGKDHDQWMKHKAVLDPGMEKMMASDNLKDIRVDFVQLSNQMISLSTYFAPLDSTLYVLHCPMADSNKGADWLSKETEIKNPYFGKKMLGCGEVRREVKGTRD